MRTALFAALVSLAVTLPGCTGASPTRATAPTGQPIQMAQGELISLPGGATLRYVEVAADSRCPPGVQCIRAGDADVVFEFTESAKTARRITINTDPPATATLGKWHLRLLALAFGASPKATVQIDPAN
ncbi:MAG: hypothetical protein ACREPE_08360 [Lysobacter sp.]